MITATSNHSIIFQGVFKRERFFQLGLSIKDPALLKCRLEAKKGEVDIKLYIKEDSPSLSFKVSKLESLKVLLLTVRHTQPHRMLQNSPQSSIARTTD